jgi:hypothetical protein
MLLPSIVLLAGTGVTGISQRLGARLPVGAVRRIAAEGDLIPLEDRSTSQLVRIAGLSNSLSRSGRPRGIDIVFASGRNRVTSRPMVSGWIREA